MQTLKLQLKIIITVILCGILFVSNFTVIKAENKLTNIYLMGDSTVSSRDNDYINGWEIICIDILIRIKRLKS